MEVISEIIWFIILPILVIATIIVGGALAYLIIGVCIELINAIFREENEK